MEIRKKNAEKSIRRISVDLDRRSYQILIQPGLLNQIGKIIAKFDIGKRIAIITNPTVGKYYAAPVKKALTQAQFQPVIFSIPDGEWYKNLEIVRDLYSRLLQNGFDRNTAILALGGGVIGDLAGFVAATFLRGIPFIQVPTTLLAQVDSSVGGKVGVNLPEGKNLIGSFYQPILVVIDPIVLHTLPQRETRSGLAEVIKYGMINDAAFFTWLEKNISHILQIELNYLVEIITRCCEIKAAIVSQDETEQGLRAILNFGHTIGHAIETLTDYETYRHGEAIAIGMVAAGKLAYSLKLFTRQNLMRLSALIKNVGLPTTMPILEITRVLDTIYLDKKSREHIIRMVLPTTIGNVKLVKEIPISVLQKTIRSLMKTG